MPAVWSDGLASLSSRRSARGGGGQAAWEFKAQESSTASVSPLRKGTKRKQGARGRCEGNKV